MNLNKKYYKVFLKKLMKEELNSDEIQLLNESLLDNDELSNFYNTTKLFWNNYTAKPLKNNIPEIVYNKLELLKYKKQYSKKMLFYQVAAGILLLVTISVSGFLFFKQHNNPSFKEYYSVNNEIIHFILSDGTKVWLNSGSSLYSIEPFKEKTRNVKLIGEAYFEVASNNKKPFIIDTHKLKAKVLGTAFNINSWPESKTQEIELYEGTLMLEPTKIHTDSVLLKAGQRAQFVNDNNNFIISNIKKTNTAGWRNGILEFNNDNLFNIAVLLERKFETQIFITNNNTGSLRFTAEFTNEPLTDILELLTEAKYFSYEITDQGILIK